MSGTRRNGTRKIGPAVAGRPRGERSSADLRRRGGREHASGGGGADEAAGRHAAAQRHVPGRKSARTRAGKAVPAAVIAATLAAGAAAYGIASSGGTSPGSLAEAIASVPPGGYQVSGTGALGRASAAGSPGASSPVVASVATAAARPAAPEGSAGAGSLAEVIVSSMTSSRRVLGGVAKKAAAAQEAKASAAQAAKASAAPAASATPAATKAPAKATTTALTCDASRGMLPANVTAIVSFLLAHGYTHNAAAGIAGNIYRESMGNPESVGSGGGGLIGWTPLPAGFVTGNPAADLQTQLAAVLTYNQGWAQYIPALNAAASPTAAADIYVTDFERAGIPAAGQREASAESVAAACGLLSRGVHTISQSVPPDWQKRV